MPRLPRYKGCTHNHGIAEHLKNFATQLDGTLSGDYTVTTISVGEGVVEVAAPPQGRTRLDFYAQALDDRENSIFEAGSAAVPKSAFAEAGSKSSRAPSSGS